MHRSRRFGVRIAIAAGLVALAAPATADATTSKPTAAFSPVPANDHVTLTFVTYIPTLGATAAQTLTGLIDGFEAAHPDITVDVQASTTSTGAAISAVVEQDESAGQAPDVVQIGLDAIRYTAAAFGARNLEKTVGPAALAAEWGGKYPYATAVRGLGLVNGVTYAIPWVLSTPVLFYNASLFEKAGLDPADPPTNWTEVMDDALAIQKATGADGLSNCAVGETSVNVDWCMQAIIRSDGGTVLSSNGKSLTFDNPKTIDAMKVMQQLGASGAMVNLTNAQAVSEFGQGKLAMVLNSSAAQGVLLSAAAGKFDLRDAKLPGFGSEASTPTNSGSALGILAKSSLAQRASWELIQYLTSDSSYAAITKNIGYAPLRPGLLTDDKYLGNWTTGKSLLSANMAQIEHIVPWQDYPGGNYGQIETLLENAAASIAFEKGNPTSTMDSTQAQASALLP